ncbi:MAG: diguanylate cyclase [Rhizobiales bacterium]|nr:diguanylate cyclase [Hyphomicrobiales bacterium]
MGNSEQILIVEEIAGSENSLTNLLSDTGISCLNVIPGNGLDNILPISSKRPQAILVDSSSFGTENNGSDSGSNRLMQNLAKLSQLAIDEHIPMILLAGQGEQMEGFLPAAPWDDILIRPVSALQIINRISSLNRLGTMQSELNRRITTSMRYGVDAPKQISMPVEFDDAAILVLGTGQKFAAIERVLSPHATLTGAFTLDTAVEYMQRRDFDAVVVEVQEDGMTALDFAALVRRHSRFFNVPLIALGDADKDDWCDTAIGAGYSEILGDDVLDDDLERRIMAHVLESRFRESLRAVYREARHMSTSDGLTGLFSRGFLFEHLRTIMNEAGPNENDFSVVAFGIRDMAGLNEAYDYAIGDRMIRQVGEVMSFLLRGEDLAARYSGAIFVAILPDTDPVSALAATKRITSVVRFTEFSVPEVDGPIRIDIASGVAGYQPGENPEKLVLRALSWLQT